MNENTFYLDHWELFAPADYRVNIYEAGAQQVMHGPEDEDDEDEIKLPL